MMRLLWLVTLALGHRMLWEQTYHFSYDWMVRLQRVLQVASVAWVAGLLWTAVWFWNQP